VLVTLCALCKGSHFYQPFIKSESSWNETWGAMTQANPDKTTEESNYQKEIKKFVQL